MKRLNDFSSFADTQAGKDFCLNLLRKSALWGMPPSDIMMKHSPFPTEKYAFDNIVFHTAYGDYMKEQAAINGNPIK